MGTIESSFYIGGMYHCKKEHVTQAHNTLSKIYAIRTNEWWNLLIPRRNSKLFQLTDYSNYFVVNCIFSSALSYCYYRSRLFCVKQAKLSNYFQTKSNHQLLNWVNEKHLIQRVNQVFLRCFIVIYYNRIILFIHYSSSNNYSLYSLD